MSVNPKEVKDKLGSGCAKLANLAAASLLHVRAAANNGVSRDEVKEVLLQAAIYCGVPAANSAFRIAAEIFAEMGNSD